MNSGIIDRPWQKEKRRLNEDRDGPRCQLLDRSVIPKHECLPYTARGVIRKTARSDG